MKNIFNLLFLMLLLLACSNKKKTFIEKKTSIQKQNTENLITRITFFENNTSVPANFEFHKYKQIEIVNDSASLIEYIYKKGQLNETKTLKSIKLNSDQKGILFSLPNEYLKKDEYSIGNPSPLDEDIFKVIITLNNNKKVQWKMNYDKDKIPDDILPFFQLFFRIKQQIS